jgi:hypothetical protein
MDNPTPTIGRTVLFVLPSTSRRAGEIRPASVVRVNSLDPVYGSINLSVQLDGPHDSGEPKWQGSVHQDQDGKKPGTWHWMDYQVQQHQAGTSVHASPPAPAADGKTSGQVAYEAYCETTNWKSLATGMQLPQWQDQRPEISAAWEAAATAVLARA